jgi:magnesium-transporting ATPase (P-type)
MNLISGKNLLQASPPKTLLKIFNSQFFIRIVALKDPLREVVKKSFDFVKKVGVTVRLISGDNLDSAKAYADDCVF